MGCLPASGCEDQVRTSATGGRGVSSFPGSGPDGFESSHRGSGVPRRRGRTGHQMADLGIRLEAKMTQSLVMTPRLQQAIKLLQYNHIDMVQHVQEAMLENP